LSLHDEHLRQALQHAPDGELAPDAAVRKNVLNYAAKVAGPKPETWFKRLINILDGWRVTNWQLAGMSSVAVALLVMVMVHEQVPDDAIWVKSEVKDVAQSKVVTPAASALEQDKLETRQDEPARGLDAAAASAEKAPVSAEGMQAKAKSSLPADAIASKKLAEKTEAASVVPESADINNVAVTTKTPEVVITASAPEVGSKQVLSKAAPASAPAVSGMAANVDPIAETLAKEGSIAMAKKDIEAGNLRMLKIIEAQECTKTGQHESGKQESSVDALTNYQIAEIEVCATDDKVSRELLHREVDTYNQTMLHWYQTHKD
jgi:hypothetical protein